jgi:hypothetical protein
MRANLENRIADNRVVHLTATPTQRHAFSDIVRRGMALGTIFGQAVGRYLHKRVLVKLYSTHTLPSCTERGMRNERRSNNS